MGSGASSLTNEQKAEVAKEMKEKYESMDPADQPSSQANLIKHYDEIVSKFQTQKEENSASVGLGGGMKLKKLKKKVQRMRSFENGLFLLENVAHPKKEHGDPEQDFWDSVKTQPSCLVCKMVFTTESKLDTHTKYSEVHKRNLQAIEALEKLKSSADSDTAEVKVVPPEAPSCRCRELYSGSKFYWRLQDTLEYHVYLHLESNCVEVIPYDNHSQTEYGRLYFDENKLFNLVGLDKIMERVRERQADFEKEREKTNHRMEPPKEEDLVADERRQFVVSLLMSKLQLSIPDSTTGTKVVDCKLKVTEETDPLYKTPPESVKPVLIKRRRLSTTEEIEAALLQATDMELEINVKLHEAEELENLAHMK